MKITDNLDWKVVVADYETFKRMSLFSYYNPDKDEWYEFEISAYRNDLLKFVNFHRKDRWDYAVYYNGIAFDCPIAQHIISNYAKWIDLPNLEVVTKIFEYAQEVIENKKYNLFLDYREDNFEIPCIDVFCINGLDGEARRSSLKKVEFQLDYPSVEEMPIPFDSEYLSEEDCALVRSYARNDIMATYELFKLTLGDTDHAIYKGNNQIELRLSIKEEFEINCLNYSDIKLGDELMKKYYTEAKGISIKDLPKKGTFRRQIDLKKCIPSYVEYKTPLLQKLLVDLKKTHLRRTDKWERKFIIGTTEYVQALGGLHSVNSNEVWEAKGDMIIEDDDVASYYPKIIIENGYYPFHLGKELLNVYTKVYEKRVGLKPLAKTDKKIKGIVEALKLVLNSIFGKLGSMESWLYDAQALYSVTLTGQCSLLMLIEEYELNGIKVISANSDGVTTYFNKNLIDKKNEIIKKWQDLTHFEIETVRFKKFIYSTVNDYLAIKEDGSKKVKGDFISDFELWKNKSWRVVALSLQEYFVNGKSPEEFIKNHKNIYDFCIMARATGNLYLEMQKEEEVIKLKKLVRYYLSNTSEWQLFKRGVGSTGKNANISTNAPNEVGECNIQYFNQYEEKKMADYNIAVEHYVLKSLKFVDKIEGTKKAKHYLDSLKPQIQMTLF